MRIEITTRNIERPARHRRAVASAVRTALERHRGRVARVAVTIADVNGPRGGHDKRCTVSLVGPRLRRPVVVSATDLTVRGALRRAVARALRTTVRRVERHGTARRRGTEGEVS